MRTSWNEQKNWAPTGDERLRWRVLHQMGGLPTHPSARAMWDRDYLWCLANLVLDRLLRQQVQPALPDGGEGQVQIRDAFETDLKAGVEPTRPGMGRTGQRARLVDGLPQTEQEQAAQHSQSLYHKVVKGDTLWAIARQYGVQLEELVGLNPQIKTPTSSMWGRRYGCGERLCEYRGRRGAGTAHPAVADI